MKFNNSLKHGKRGFTLTELLLACAVVGVIACLVLPAVITSNQENAMEKGYNREVQSISNAVDALVINENKSNFHKTMMYVETEPESYAENAGLFLKKYFPVSEYCGDSNGDCFADKYYEYADGDKKEYSPTYKGACAKLKNGASLCITPQVGATNSIAGIIDINGAKGPNIKDRDLRTFTLAAKTIKGIDTSTVDVMANNKPIDVEKGPCEINSLSKECCDTKSVSKGDPCCVHYSSIPGHACYEKPKTACETDPKSLACCREKGVNSSNKSWCCDYSEFAGTSACKGESGGTALSCYVSPMPISGCSGFTNYYYYSCSISGSNTFMVSYRKFIPSKCSDESATTSYSSSQALNVSDRVSMPTFTVKGKGSYTPEVHTSFIKSF